MDKPATPENTNPLLGNPAPTTVVAPQAPQPVEGQVLTPGGDNGSNSKKTLMYVGIGFGILLLLAGIYLVLAKFMLNMWPFAQEIVQAPVAQQQVVASPSPVASPDETLNWKTYTGETFYTTDGSSKFSIKYPSTWVLEGSNLFPEGKKGTESDPVITLGAGGHGMGDQLPQTLYLPAGNARYWAIEQDDKTNTVIASIESNNKTYIIEGENLTQEQSKILVKMLQTLVIPSN
jgi:hypothetical protein